MTLPGRMVPRAAALWLTVGACHALVVVGVGLFGTAPSWISDAIRLDEPARIERTLARRDQTFGFPPGTHQALWDALVTHVPEDGVIHVDIDRDAVQARAAKPILILGFPRRGMRHRGSRIEALWPEGEYALFFGKERAAWLAGKRTQLASGPDWTLWR